MKNLCIEPGFARILPAYSEPGCLRKKEREVSMKEEAASGIAISNLPEKMNTEMMVPPSKFLFCQ
jgi:hypothetical protein